MATVFCDPDLTTGDDDGSTWPNGYQSLQAAIDNAGSGDEVWVKSRTITLTSTIDVDNSNDPDIYGGFDNALTGTAGSVAGRDLDTNITTLDGDDSYQCVSMVGWEGTFDGFKIYDANYGSGSGAGMRINTGVSTINIKNCEFESCTTAGTGGACRVDGTTTPTFTDCSFTSNSAGNAGAIYCSSGGSPTFDNCTFTTNTATTATTGIGGAIQINSGDLTCTDCTFDTNSSAGWYGGAIQIGSTGTGVFTDCVFDTNSCGRNGGAVHITGGGSGSSFTRCKIDNNSVTIAGSYGGGVCCYGGSDIEFTNCVVTNNSSGGYEGGIGINHDGSATITNCTIADNSCAYASGGGGVRCQDGSDTLVMTNCILWGNTANSVANQLVGTGSITVSYTNVQGGYTGTGNVNANPNFLGSGDDPYDLSSASASVDSGNASATNYPTLDILGRTRKDDSGTSNTGTGTPDYSDMGAYEFQPVVAGVTVSLLLAFN